MPSVVEYQLWRQLKNAFLVDRIIFVPVTTSMDDPQNNFHLEQYATIEEALEASVGQRVFLEPTGTKGMSDIPEGDIVLITGCTTATNLAFAQADETYQIKSPQRTALYPHEAAAIALAIRYGQ